MPDRLEDWGAVRAEIDGASTRRVKSLQVNAFATLEQKCNHWQISVIDSMMQHTPLLLASSHIEIE